MQSCHNVKSDRVHSVIVVGGGTAGLVVATNLSSHCKVTVLDQGIRLPVFSKYRIPLLIGLLYGNENPYVKKKDYRGFGGRLTPFFESNLTGGASSMNGAVHVLGNSRFIKSLGGRFGFGEVDVISAVRDLFSKNGREKKKIALKRAPKGAVESAFFEACAIRGYSEIDTEYLDSVGFGSVINNAGRFFRSTVLALTDLRKFNLLNGVKIQRLLLENGKVVGVQSFSGNIYKADIIILCAGVVQSNAIVMRTFSGMDASPLVQSYQQAGLDIRDHTNVRINVRSKRSIGSLNEIYHSVREKIFCGLQYAINMPSLLSGTGATATLHFSSSGNSEPDVRLNFLRFHESGRMGSDGSLLGESLPGFSFSITAYRPISTGSIKIVDDEVVVDLGHLKDIRDIAPIKAAVSETLKLLNTPPLQDYVHSIDCVNEIEQDLDSYIRANAYSGYHLVGGLHRLVNADLSLKCLDGVYVCDASIMEDHPSSNIHASVLLLAYLFSARLSSQLTRLDS